MAKTTPDGEALRKTPDEWAQELFPPGSRGRPHPDSWKHGAADALHRWTLHAHHFASEPVSLTRSDYEAALTAASTLVDGDYRPHAAALGKA